MDESRVETLRLFSVVEGAKEQAVRIGGQGPSKARGSEGGKRGRRRLVM